MTEGEAIAWKVADGLGVLETGNWQLHTGHWQLETGNR
jgi:hypothetical protein